MQHSAPRAPDRHRDSGGIVLGWLTKIVVVAAIVGLVGFDAMAVFAGRMGIIDQGEAAARAASDSWKQHADVQDAYDAASKTASDANLDNTIDPKSFRVDDDGTVHLRVEREVTTLLLHRIGRLREWATVGEEVTGKAPV